MELTQQIQQFLESEGYEHLRLINGRGICGIRLMLYTVGVFYDIDLDGYKGRYCYPDQVMALVGLTMWSGEGDPKDPYWIRHKGTGGDYWNPSRQKAEE